MSVFAGNGTLCDVYYDEKEQTLKTFENGVEKVIASGGGGGVPGPQGPAGTVEVGSVKEVEQGEAAVRNVGTAENAILEFDVPKGNNGAQGEKGNTPIVSITASVAGEEVDVEKTGTDESPNFDFKFDKISADVEISQEPNNAIEKKPDGLYAKVGEIIIDPDETNAIEKKATGLYAKNLKPELDELKLFKTPNATPTGTPAVNNGHISGFSANDYYRFPFLVDFKGRHFQIDTEFTTSDDVATQQNIFDSDFGFAFAIRSGKFVIAMSSNGTAWNIGEGVGTHNVQANATYRVRLSWDGSVYKLEYSTDGGQTYNVDIEKASAESLYPRQIYIGVGENFGSVQNFFKGSINFNNCSLTIANELVWQGMDSAGIASRLATDASNIDAAGEKKIKDIVGVEVREVPGSVTDYIPKATTEQYGLVKMSSKRYSNGVNVDKMGNMCAIQMSAVNSKGLLNFVLDTEFRPKIQTTCVGLFYNGESDIMYVMLHIRPNGLLEFIAMTGINARRILDLNDVNNQKYSVYFSFAYSIN